MLSYTKKVVSLKFGLIRAFFFCPFFDMLNFQIFRDVEVLFGITPSRAKLR